MLENQRKEDLFEMRNKKIKWEKDAEDYVIKNYGSLSNKEIAEHLKTTVNKVRCKAAHLRWKGQPVFKYPFINWQDPEMKTQLFTEYGGKPTHQVAEKFGRAASTIYRATRNLGLSFRGNVGRYTFGELVELLKIDYKTIKKWPGCGLKITAYAKDSLTYSLSRKGARKIEEPKYFWALIDLDDLKRFLKSRPEACDLTKLDEETKHQLELNNLKIVWKEKKVSCKKCNYYFWTTLHNNKLRCPKCGRMVSKWAIDYR